MTASGSPSASERRAVVDIGTNSVKLLLAEVGPGGIVPLRESSDQTRLGRGFYENQVLQPGPLRETARAVARYVGEARAAGAHRVTVVATSAAREAVNGEALRQAVFEACGLPVRVISGEEEADWAFRGVASDPALHGASLLIVDAGGGSSELVLGREGRVRFRRSFKLGTVRLLEQYPVSDPPLPAEWARCHAGLCRVLEDEVLPALRPQGLPGAAAPVTAVGASGTATILARLEKGIDGYDREMLDGVTLSCSRLGQWRERLWGLPLAERRRIPGLPHERADVMLTGAAIYEAMLRHLELSELRVSLRGLRFAALLEETGGAT